MKITFLFFLISFCNLFATNYYVNPIQGNDGNNGTTENTAFRTLSRIQGISLQPGDTVFLMNGTYNSYGGNLLVIDESGTEDAWITIQNYPGHSPLLKFEGWTGIDLINGASYIAIKGLRIQGARSQITLEQALAQPGSCDNDQQGDANGFYNGTGILAVGPNLRWTNPATTGNEVPHHILIENCEIFDCTSSGIACQQADYVTIRNNTIYNNAWYTLYGTSGVNFYQFINTDGSTGIHNEISNNLLYGNEMKVPQVPYCQFFDGNAVIVDDFKHVQTGNYLNPSITYDSYSAKTIVKNNIVVENGGSGLHFYLSENCLIYNNTVVNNAFQNDGLNGNGELRVGECSNFEIKNNIFKGEHRIHWAGGNINMDYSNNYHEGPGIIFEFRECDSCFEEGISFDNMDRTSATPYLSSVEEILKGTGEIIPEVSVDYLYRIRSLDDGIDIGAYELGACIPSTWYADNDGDGIGSSDDTVESCEQPEGYVSEDGDQCDNDPDKTEADIWYADSDGDGTGTSNDIVEACEQPQGYVATSGDQCDNDPDKLTPGECGCGVEEGTCDDLTGNCAAPSYSSSTTYSQAGTVVTYLGRAYQNKWYARGTLPTSGGPWVLIEVCDGSGEDCSTIPDWNATTTYANPGTKVSYNSKVYRNKWYSFNQTPGNNQVWEFIDACLAPQNLNTTLYRTSENQKLEEEFTVYPTIFSSNITVEGKSTTQIHIFNAFGELIKSDQIVNEKKELHMTTIKSGLYFVHLENASSSSIIKIIKP